VEKGNLLYSDGSVQLSLRDFTSTEPSYVQDFVLPTIQVSATSGGGGSGGGGISGGGGGGGGGNNPAPSYPIPPPPPPPWKGGSGGGGGGGGSAGGGASSGSRGSTMPRVPPPITPPAGNVTHITRIELTNRPAIQAAPRTNIQVSPAPAPRPEVVIPLPRKSHRPPPPPEPEAPAGTKVIVGWILLGLLILLWLALMVKRIRDQSRRKAWRKKISSISRD